MAVTLEEGSAQAASVDAYLYIRPGGSGGSSKHQEILQQFTTAVASTLSPNGAGQVVSTSALKQTFNVSNGTLSMTELRSLRQNESVTKFESQFHVEVLLLPSHPSPRPVRLAVFDMDSTLIDQETIDELARTIGKTEEVGALTERAMRGELDFAEALQLRVAMLRGVRADVWEMLRDRLTLAPGAKALCDFLKKKGVTMAVFSGGFQPMAEWLKGELGLDLAAANHLVEAPPSAEFPYPHLAGELVAGQPIVTADRKRALLYELAAKLNVPLSETLCVGDGANDLPMLQAVGNAGGIAVACRAKPIVQAEAPNRLNTGNLEDLVHLFV